MVTNSEHEEERSDTVEQTRSQFATQPMPHRNGSSADAEQELQRVREELFSLQGKLDTQGRRRHRVTRLRQIVAALLAVVAALGVTLSVIGVWAGRTTLNTDRWVETVTPLDKDPAVRAAVSTYVTAQIFSTLNVQQRVSQALPPKAAFLATPLTGQVHGLVQNTVNTVLASPQFAQLWPEMNRVAHKQVMAILDKNSKVVQSSGDTVTLNLLPVVNQVLAGLEQQVPTIFGKTVNLPTLTNGQIPPGLNTRIESALGVSLPANFAAIPIYQGDQLSAAQQAVVQIKQALGLLVAGTIIALVLALWISPRRRRTTLQFGVWLVLSVATLTALIKVIRADLIDQVPAGIYRSGADAGVQVVFASLRERGTQLLWLGIVIALVAYLVGPGRAPVALRQGVVRAAHFVGERARRYGAVAVAQGPGLARAHLDALRVGGAVVAVALLLVFTSWTSLFVLAVVLALYEVLVTAVAGAGRDKRPTGERMGSGASDGPQMGPWTGSTA